MSGLTVRWRFMTEQWPTLSFYQRFESALAFALTIIIQTKVVILIALLALARKFIIMDLKETTPEQMLGLAAITVALGVTCWLMRERDDRLGRNAAR